MRLKVKGIGLYRAEFSGRGHWAQASCWCTFPINANFAPRFVPLDGGVDRACRGTKPGDNSASRNAALVKLLEGLLALIWGAPEPTSGGLRAITRGLQRVHPEACSRLCCD